MYSGYRNIETVDDSQPQILVICWVCFRTAFSTTDVWQWPEQHVMKWLVIAHLSRYTNGIRIHPNLQSTEICFTSLLRKNANTDCKRHTATKCEYYDCCHHNIMNTAYKYIHYSISWLHNKTLTARTDCIRESTIKYNSTTKTFLCVRLHK